ncbi:hypothetical protein RM190_00495 [Paracoccus sp. CPCC 101403]|uniref:DNA-binding protein n=1 Tax=Paracoccus broussonetiae TaxID=3075834 RepID=A0ABU3E7W8_9RHOB|nr:hypothetical protein [Paracoccus sp. CPCC 101403]MDT1060311.1 hypothetical protein [Paracoccus sp. CPCC 101403]
MQVHPETLRRWRRQGRGPRWVAYAECIRYFPENPDQTGRMDPPIVRATSYAAKPKAEADNPVRRRTGA